MYFCIYHGKSFTFVSLWPVLRWKFLMFVTQFDLLYTFKNLPAVNRKRPALAGKPIFIMSSFLFLIKLSVRNCNKKIIYWITILHIHLVFHALKVKILFMDIASTISFNFIINFCLNCVYFFKTNLSSWGCRGKQ